MPEGIRVGEVPADVAGALPAIAPRPYDPLGSASERSRTGARMTRSAVSPRLSASQRQNWAVRVLMIRGDEQESQEQAMTESLLVLRPRCDDRFVARRL